MTISSNKASISNESLMKIKQKKVRTMNITREEYRRRSDLITGILKIICKYVEQFETDLKINT